MTSPWQRRRQPDDVPTPVAVAVSDFCRRAKSTASPAEVREALALLAEADDFRVRALTDAEPEASPLGPFALVDVLGGTPASLAARRQDVGYYDVVRELARVREEKTPAPAPAAPEVPTFAEARPAAPEKPARKQADASVQDRIAPKKRAPAPMPVELEEEEPQFLKRDLPKPRGRFTRLDAPKTAYGELTRPEGREVLETAIAGHDHRFSLLRNLAEMYNGIRGELTQVDLENALRDHGLLESLEARERQNVLAAYGDQRGAAGRVGWALELSPSELQRLVRSLKLEEDVEAVRERFRREALAANARLTHKLDLLGRDKYLADLGIKKRFTDSLRKELEKLVRDEVPEATDLHGLADRVAQKHGAPTELVARAFDRLGMAEGLRKQLQAAINNPSP
ncbi:hypothetical protein P2318_16725 [Myxococcaceae bacterium GXIMD 01537]